MSTAGAVDAHLAEWQDVLGLGMRFVANCGTAYERAGDKTRRLFSEAVVRRIEVWDGRIASVEYLEPFDVLCVARPSSHTGILWT